MLIAGDHVVEAERVNQTGRVLEKRLDPMADQALDLRSGQSSDGPGVGLAVLQQVAPARPPSW